MSGSILRTIVICATWWAGLVAVAADSPPSSCRFVGESLVPQLAMGVRRLDGDDIDVLTLHDTPGGTAEVREVPLFRPLFVVDSRADTAGAAWHLVQDGYTAAMPLGWARGDHVHLFDSRYAYTFASRRRDPRADLHDDSRESYERLRAQVAGDPRGGEETVVVREREGAEAWNPVTVTDVVPFVELRIPHEKRDREHPDTTPTFRFGIPVENRLVHVGAVCGGPVDDERLRRLRETFVDDRGLEMLFVVDETTSMDAFMRVVARFIRDAGELAVGQPVPVRIAVCAYTDGPPGTRVRLGEFRSVKGPADVRSLAEEVAKLGYDLPDEPYANTPERMLEGLRDALDGKDRTGREGRPLAFQKGATLFVAVVGDTGHEPTDPGRNALVREVAGLIRQTGANVYFMHVGRRRTPEEQLFKSDYEAIAAEAGKLGVARARLVYQPAEENDLHDALEQARKTVEQERRRLQRQIARMESRSPYTEPGPKLLKKLEERGIDRATFEDRHLQYFVPSRGWLFHPASRDNATAQPQLREFFLLAPAERQATGLLFAGVRDTLVRGGQIDGDAVVAAFARELAAASGHPAVEKRAVAAWNRIPSRQRSVGVFMEDVFGVRMKSALPFPPNAFAKEEPATMGEVERLLERIGRLGEAFRKNGDAAFWFDASSLVP